VNTSLSHYQDSHQCVTQQIRCDTQNSPKYRYHLLGMDIQNGEQSLINQVLQVNTSLSHYKDSHQCFTQQIRCDTQNSPKFRYHLLGMDIQNGEKSLINQVLQVNTSLSHYKDSHQCVTQQI